MNRLRFLLCTLFIATIIFSCTKDDNLGRQELKSTTESPNLSNYQWTAEEKDFFSLDNKIGLISLRDENNIGISPQILNAYSFIVEENERDNFATEILENVGYPLWIRGYTFTSKPSGEVKLTLIPLIKSQANSINRVLTIYEDLTGKVLNGITRSEVISDLTKKSKTKHGYLKYINKQEEILFEEASIEVKTALCDIKQIM